MSKGVLVDVTRCMGCKSCQVACKSWNDLPANVPDVPEFSDGLNSPAETNGYTYTTVAIRTVAREDDYVLRFCKRQCMHCLEPACVSACFARALQRDPQTGAVVYNQNMCVGCRYCMLACPFNIPKFQWDKTFPIIGKCQFCFDPNGKLNRIGQGLAPACVRTCPTSALQFGEREALLKEARERIKKNPAYIKHIYGEKEIGGTAWLYISDTPLEIFGFRQDLGTRPLPEYTASYLKFTPYVAVGWTILLTALYLYTKRREAVEEEKKSAQG
ncbi:MAG: 4Fe-4S dicluster domain-containing protein [Bacillota bacterium]